MDLQLQCDSLRPIEEISVENLADKVTAQLRITLQTFSDTSEFQNTSSGPHDQKLTKAVQEAQIAVDSSFIIAKDYVTKVNLLAKYICDEKQYTIIAIKEGNAEEFKEYHEEVFDRSKRCQSNFQTSITFIDNKAKEVDELKEQVDEERKAALGLNSRLTAGHCEEALRTIEEMKSNLQKIEESLKTVNLALKAEIYHNYEDISDSKLKKLSENREIVKRALKQEVEGVAEGANRLKEYCEPLKESKNLKEFIQRIASTS